MVRPLAIALATAVLLASSPPPAAAQGISAFAVPRYEGLGGFTRKVTTASPEAQAYFASVNYEYPVNAAVPLSPILAAWGPSALGQRVLFLTHSAGFCHEVVKRPSPTAAAAK